MAHKGPEGKKEWFAKGYSNPAAVNAGGGRAGEH